MVNVNIYDESTSYNKISPSNYSYFENEFIKGYSNKLLNVGAKFQNFNFKGGYAVEYSFNQGELPTKAIYFIKDKKSYLIQIGSYSNLSIKFNNLKNTFNFL